MFKRGRLKNLIKFAKNYQKLMYVFFERKKNEKMLVYTDGKRLVKKINYVNF